MADKLDDLIHKLNNWPYDDGQFPIKAEFARMMNPHLTTRFMKAESFFVDLDTSFNRSEEIVQTYEQMEECKVLAPPYDDYVVWVKGENGSTVFGAFVIGAILGKEMEANTPATVENLRNYKHVLPLLPMTIKYKIHREMGDNPGQPSKTWKEYLNAAVFCNVALLVMLATRGIAHESFGKKSWKMGIGKDSKKFGTGGFTRLRPGAVYDRKTGELVPEGIKKRPHWRRGHVRDQRVGEGLREIRKVFISPMFINLADDTTDEERKGYVVGKEAQQGS